MAPDPFVQRRVVEPVQTFVESLDENVLARSEVALNARFRFTYDPSKQALEVNDEGVVLVPGERVQMVVLDDGTVIVDDGRVVGGDPFRGLPFTSLGVTYQQALADYLVTALDELVSDERYPEGGEGRIEQVDAD